MNPVYFPYYIVLLKQYSNTMKPLTTYTFHTI